MKGQTTQVKGPVTLGVDVGGTKVRAGLVGANGSIASPVIEFNPRAHGSAEMILSSFATGLGEALKASPLPVGGIGIGIPGPFDYARGISLMRGVAKYDALYGVDLGEALRYRLPVPPNVPVTFLNDAAAFALGEWAFGSAHPYRRVMAVTLGTGCGSAFLVDGGIVTEGEGVSPGGYVYNLPFRGRRIDDYLSRRGILALWRDRFARKVKADGAGWEWNAAVPGEKPAQASVGGSGFGDLASGIDVSHLARAALNGSTPALELFRTWGSWISEALAGVIRSFRPECLVFGGNISRSLELFSAPIEDFLSTLPWEIDLLVAHDLENASIKGAAMYAASSSDQHGGHGEACCI